MYLLTCFHISIELPLNCRLPLNSHSRSQYTLYVCTYVSIHIISQLTNTPIHNVMSFHIAHSFVFRRNFFFAYPYLNHWFAIWRSLEQKWLTNEKSLKSETFVKVSRPQPWPMPWEKYTVGYPTGMSRIFLIKKGVIVKIYKLYTPDNVYNFECLNFHEHSFNLNQHIFDYCNRHQRHKKCFELEVAL